MGRPSILKGPPIMTAYSDACYRAKTAARLFLTRAFVAPGFESPADLPGYRFTDSATGLVVILNRSGNVDRPATAAARKAAAAKEEAEREELAADLAPAIESGPVGPDWQPARPSESFYAQAPRLPDGRPGPFAFGPSEEAARAALARKMEEAPRPLSDLLEEEAGAKAAAVICRPSIGDMAPQARPLTAQEQEAAAAFETAAEEAEGRRDWRAAALAWAEGAKLCRAAGQDESAALWEGHCRRAAGEAFKAAAKARRAASPKPAPPDFRGPSRPLPVTLAQGLLT